MRPTLVCRSAAARTPRSVSDATRFTPTTPHAASKPDHHPPPSRFSSRGSTDASARSASSRFQNAGSGRTPPPPGSAGKPGAIETPEQRVARLRAAHLAARTAEVSRFDRFVDRSRPILDTMHRLTVAGLIGFTVIATVVTGYAAVDMISYNRKRKAEFIEKQREMETDSLQAARLAYMRGDATPEQVTLVDEANSRGVNGSIFGDSPAPWSSPAAPPASPDVNAAQQQTGWQLLKGFMFGGSKAEDDGGATKAEAPKQEKDILDPAGAVPQLAKASGSSIRLSKPSTPMTLEAAPAAEAPVPPPKKGWFW